MGAYKHSISTYMFMYTEWDTIAATHEDDDDEQSRARDRIAGGG